MDVSARPVISVVIPTFQCAKLLADAIESVLGQQYPIHKFEIIVVDDGSTDETAQVARRFANRIRYFYQRNSGVAAARNAGIAAALGTFVAFLDADDYWLPDRLSTISEQFGDADQLVTTDFFVRIDDRTNVTTHYRGRSLEWAFELNPGEQLKLMLEDNFLSYMIVVPRRIFDEVGTFDESLHYGEDWDLWLRCLAAGYPVRLIRQPLAVYRYLRPGSSTTRNDFSKAQDRVRILARYRSNVSRRRWQMAVGVMHHVGFRDSWGSRKYTKALGHWVQLFANPIYLWQRLGTRWSTSIGTSTND